MALPPVPAEPSAPALPSAVALVQAGLARHQAGQADEAERFYRAALAVDADEPNALHLWGLLAKAGNRLELAASLIRRAIAILPELAAMHANLGNVLRAAGQDEAAVGCFHQALALEPDFAEARFALAVTLHSLGRQDAALPVYARLLQQAPWHRDAAFNMGVACQNIGRLEPAVALYRRVLVQEPAYALAHNNLSATLRHQARLPEAIIAAGRALALEPGLGEAAKNLAFACLLLGDYDRGLPAYEGRRQAVDGHIPTLSVPEWRGEPLKGDSILLLAEQGLGDTLQMVRYAPLLKARGAGPVLLACPAPLLRLLRGAAGLDAVLPREGSIPRPQWYLPLMSLPYRCGTTLATIPAPVPYLQADPALCRHWQTRLAALESQGAPGGKAIVPPRQRVGLVWAGNPGHRGDRLRSQRLENFLPLLRARPDFRWYGLQLGVGRRDLEEAALPDGFVDLGPEIADFADTAAIIANLDRVIAVDTSVAHLAGALGKPVWILLPFVPDWRWMMQRSDSPWYPTARLFRQTDPAGFAEVFAALAQALLALP